MRPGAFIPALALGAALLAPPWAEADRHRSPEHGRRSGYDRSGRDQGRYERGRPSRSPRGDYSRHSHRPARPHWNSRGHYRPPRAHYRPYYRPRPPGYYRPYYRPYYYGYRPYPPRYSAPWPAPYGYPGPAYGPWPPHRGGVHGSVAIGLPFIGFSLHF